MTTDSNDMNARLRRAGNRNRWTATLEGIKAR